jgi:hypothetical protein
MPESARYVLRQLHSDRYLSGFDFQGAWAARQAGDPGGSQDVSRAIGLALDTAVQQGCCLDGASEVLWAYVRLVAVSALLGTFMRPARLLELMREILRLEKRVKRGGWPTQRPMADG